MVARIPVGLSTSALLHAGALTLLVLIPVAGRAPFHEPATEKVLVFSPPALPRTRVASEGPIRTRQNAPRRAPALELAPPTTERVPAVPRVDSPSEEVPIDSGTTCLACPNGEAGAPSSGEGLAGVGSSTAERTGIADAGPRRVGSGVEAPRKLVHVAPRYPELARRAGLDGTVELDCVIDAAGAVSEIRVLDGSALFRDAAIEAVRRWRYTPTRLNEVPVPILMKVTVRFSLRRES